MTPADPPPLDRCGVVLLGGTAGVGLETATQFASAGSRVVLLGRNAERGRAAVDHVLARVPSASAVFAPVDALDTGDVQRTVAWCADQLDGVDVLVCSTGPSRPPQLLHDVPADEIRDRIDEIVLPPLHAMHAALTHMRARGHGAVITVASDAAKSATPGETLIGAAMAAITMFCKAAALEAKREGVRINVLTPSLVAGTPGAELIAADPFADKMFQKAAGLAHLGVAESIDLAALALFLASPAARRITGQAISVNGGISVA